MKLIIGLGNPGKEFAKSRHNVGFIILDNFALKNHLKWKFDNKFNARIAKFNDLLLVKPQTFMNNSGDCIAKLVKYFKLDLNNLIVTHDDVDLEFGKTRFKKSMGSAGHHGTEDIIEKLGSRDFWRLRIGVGRPTDNKFDVKNYVLDNLKEEEFDFVKNISLETLVYTN